MKLVRLFINAIKGEEKDFTSGSLKKSIFLLAIPMILEMAMESLFAVVDAYFVAKISTSAVATVGLTESVIILVYAVAIGLSMGTTAMVARRIGEKKKKEASVAAMQAIYLGLFLSIIIAFIGIFFAKDILIMMEGSDKVVTEGFRYTQIMFGGNTTILLLFLINAIFRGAGDASIAMRALIIANGINIILDPCLIFGIGPFPELGLEGAAIATTTGRAIGVAYQLSVLFGRKAMIKINWETLQVKLSVMLNLIKISLGGIGQFIISTVSWAFLVRIVSNFGSEAVAGYTLAFRVLIFTILPSWGLANAAATLVGQNLGAENPDRAESAVWKCSLYNMYFLLSVSLIFILFAEQIIGIFSNEANVIQYGADALRYVSYGYAFFAYGMVLIQAFNGAGDTATPTKLNFIFHWLIQIPLAYFLATYYNFGPNGVYIAIPISESLLTLACIYIFRKGRWKLKNV